MSKIEEKRLKLPSVADSRGTEREWLTPIQLAADLDISERQLRNLEAKGMPSFGEGAAKRYLWPDCEAWYKLYRHRYERGHRKEIAHLGLREAIEAWLDQMCLSRVYWFLKEPAKYGLEGGCTPLNEREERLVPIARKILAGTLRREDMNW